MFHSPSNALACATAFCLGLNAAAETVFQEQDGLVVMEMESTDSDLGGWKLIPAGADDYPAGAKGEGHLEYPAFKEWDVPDSPLAYRFKINEPGVYQLQFRAHKRLEGLAGDKCNDCFVRMEGDFGSGVDGLPVEALQQNFKLYGGAPSSWGVAKTLDINLKKLQIEGQKGHVKKPALYDFKAGEVYTLIVSGRSQRFNLDRIILHRKDVEMTVEKLGTLPESGKAAH